MSSPPLPVTRPILAGESQKHRKVFRPHILRIMQSWTARATVDRGPAPAARSKGEQSTTLGAQVEAGLDGFRSPCLTLSFARHLVPLCMGPKLRTLARGISRLVTPTGLSYAFCNAIYILPFVYIPGAATGKSSSIISSSSSPSSQQLLERQMPMRNPPPPPPSR